MSRTKVSGDKKILAGSPYLDRLVYSKVISDAVHDEI